MHISKFKYAFAVTAALLASTSMVQAQVTSQAVTDAAIAAMGGEKTVVTVTSSELSGNSVLLKGVSIKGEGGETTVFGDISLENVSEVAQGFKVEKISGGEFNVVDPESTMKVANWSMKNAVIPKKGVAAEGTTNLPVENLSLGAINLSLKGSQVAQIAGINLAVSPVNGNAPVDVSFKVSGINMDMTKSDPSSLAAIEALGLQTIKGEINAVGSWNPADGRLLLKEQSFDFANIGRLNLTIDISGYTADVAQQITNTLKLAGNKEASATAGFAMLGIAQKLTFNEISLRFDDASITNRILDYMAKQSGTTREAYVAQLKAMAPMLVMQIPEPGLQTAWTQAASKFLDNPKSFEIKSVQTTPIPLEKMMTGAMALPDLIKSLGITITAE
jgi:hypothetical protein